MSAWYILASLGIYPACPGTGEYLLTAPLFKKAEIRLGNGKQLTIKADHPEYPYVSEVSLNGEPVSQHFLTYEQIMAGGVLEFKLSPKPDHGRDGLPAPYSMSPRPFVSKPAITGNLHLFDSDAEVSMSCRTEGSVIHYTLDGSDPTEDSPVYSGPFKVRQSCLIKARAFKEGMDPSQVNYVAAHKKYYYPVTSMDGMTPGCRYTFHTANFKFINQIEADPEEDSGVMEAPSISGSPAEDHFAFNFFGYINVPSDGVWEFALRCDEGGELWIEGERVVSAEGSPKPAIGTGKIPLQKGLHPFKLLYFDDQGGQELVWSWRNGGSARFVPIPPSRLYYR